MVVRIPGSGKPQKNKFQIKKELADSLIERGYDVQEAAAIVGNIDHETGGTFDPSIEEKDNERTRATGKKGFGLFQYTDSRKDDLLKWAKKNNLNPNESATQIAFMDHELKTTERSARKSLSSGKSVEEKTLNFMNDFERPFKPTSKPEDRVEAALNADDQLFMDIKEEALIRGEQLPMGQKPRDYIKQRKPFRERLQESAALLPAIDPNEISPDRLLASTDPEQVDALAAAMQEESAKKIEEEAQKAEQLAPIAEASNEAVSIMEESKPKDMQGPPPPSSSGISSDTKEALQFFLPQAVGLAFGSIMEGSAGAVAGYEQAGKLRDSYNDFQFKKAELAKKTASDTQDFQVLGDFTDRFGNPVTFNKKTRQFMDMEGNPLAAGNIINAKSERSARFAEIAETGQKISKEKFDYKKELDSQLSPQQTQEIANLGAFSRTLNTVKQLKASVTTGPVAGRIQTVAQLADISPKDFTKLKTLTKSLAQEHARMFNGSRLSDADITFAEEIVPNINDAPDTFFEKVDALEEVFRNNAEALDEAIRAGQPLKKEAVERIFKTIEGFASPESLIERAKKEKDPKVRLELFRKAKEKRGASNVR